MRVMIIDIVYARFVFCFLGGKGGWMVLPRIFTAVCTDCPRRLQHFKTAFAELSEIKESSLFNATRQVIEMSGFAGGMWSVSACPAVKSTRTLLIILCTWSVATSVPRDGTPWLG